MNAALTYWEYAVMSAGALHFAQPIAMRFVPTVLDWRTDLAKLRPINRQIFKVVVGGLMLLLFGLGVLVVLLPYWMLHAPLGAGLLALLAIHWVYRLGAQVRIYWHTWPAEHRPAYWALTVLLAVKAGLYCACFCASMML